MAWEQYTTSTGHTGVVWKDPIKKKKRLVKNKKSKMKSFKEFIKENKEKTIVLHPSPEYGSKAYNKGMNSKNPALHRKLAKFHARQERLHNKAARGYYGHKAMMAQDSQAYEHGSKAREHLKKAKELEKHG